MVSCHNPFPPRASARLSLLEQEPQQQESNQDPEQLHRLPPLWVFSSPRNNPDQGLLLLSQRNSAHMSSPALEGPKHRFRHRSPRLVGVPEGTALPALRAFSASYGPRDANSRARLLEVIDQALKLVSDDELSWPDDGYYDSY